MAGKGFNTSTYLWQDGSTNSTLNVNEDGKYWVTISDVNCSLTDTFNVSLPPASIFNSSSDTTICEGDDLTLNANTFNATYLWQDNSIASSYNVLYPGSYWVEVSDKCGTRSDTLNVNYNALPVIDFGSDTTVCEYEPLILDVHALNATYLCQDYSTNSTFEVTDEDTYWVAVTVDNCTTTDSVFITDIECEVVLELPNVITPNNDGYNDFLTPLVTKGAVSLETTIYSSFGSKVFETRDELIQWDAQDIADGIYYWVVTYTDIHGVIYQKSGSVRVYR